MVFLERYILVRDLSCSAVSRSLFMLGYALIHVVGSFCAARLRAGVTAAAFATLALASDQGQFVSQDFRPVLFLPGLFVVPGLVVDASFDVNRAALFQVLARDFGGAPEGLDVVPLGLVLPVAVLVFHRRTGGQRKGGNGHATRGGLHFRVLAQVAQQNHFVDASCHENRSCLHYGMCCGISEISPRSSRRG